MVRDPKQLALKYIIIALSLIRGLYITMMALFASNTFTVIHFPHCHSTEYAMSDLVAIAKYKTLPMIDR